MLIRRVAVVAIFAGVCAVCWPGSALAHGADLFVQAAKLTAGRGPSTSAIPPSSDPTDQFGTSVAVSANGHVLVVGAPRVARIYVYVRPANGRWKDARQTIALLGFTRNDNLGTSVAVSGDGSTIVAGAPYENGGAGAVYVYVEPRGGWKDASVLPTNMLHAADSTGNDALGASVAIAAHGGTIVAGAPGWRSEQGAIYLFKRARNGWGHTNPLGGVWANVGEAGGNSAYGGVFGLSVAMSANADTIAVGAPFENGWEGGVYVFNRSHGRYLGYRELHDLASGTADGFFLCSSSSGYGVGNPELGYSVGVSTDGETIAAGEPCAGRGGQAVVYTERHGDWLRRSSNITAGLTPRAPNAAYTQQFGFSVAVSGNGRTVIGSDPMLDNGYGAFIAWFREPRDGWSHVNPPVASNFGTVSGQTASPYGDQDLVIGDPIAIGSIGGTIFVGGVGVKNEGAVYVFNETTPGATATQLSCNPAQVAAGTKSTCTVTVSDPTPHGLVPRGSVTFSSNGGASGHFNHRKCTLKVKHGKVSAARCAVTFTASSPLAYTITARYGGDVHHSPGNDQAVVRTARATSATTVSCTPPSITIGAMSSCTATATGIGSPPVTITFKVSGGTASGERCAPGRTVEVCTVGFSAASAGSYAVAAAYPGDTGHRPSSGHATVTVTAG